MFRDQCSGIDVPECSMLKIYGLFAYIILVFVDRSRPFRLIRMFLIFTEQSGH